MHCVACQEDAAVRIPVSDRTAPRPDTRSTRAPQADPKACVNCEGSGGDCFDPQKNPVLSREIKAAAKDARSGQPDQARDPVRQAGLHRHPLPGLPISPEPFRAMVCALGARLWLVDFINYRRDDLAATAGRLHDRLAQTFGRKNPFMDVDHIPAGVDFVDYLPNQVAACDVFLAVIGPNWLDAKDDDGRRRFDNPDDFVAIEIAAALARNIRVIPVLVDGARTPKADKLPDSIKPLVRRNAVEVRNTHFGRDAEELTNKVREALEGPQPVTEQSLFVASAAAWLMVPGQWRTVAGSAMALLLIGWIGSIRWACRCGCRGRQGRSNRIRSRGQGQGGRRDRSKLKAAEAEQQRQAKRKEKRSGSRC